MRAIFAATALAALLLSAPVHADTVVWKYDDWQGTIEQNADGKNKHPHKAYPGFVAGEAYGQIYRPKPGDYPIKILSVKMVVASPNVTPPGDANIDIEIWNDTSQTATPNTKSPHFKISSSEFWNPQTQKDNMPLTGNTAMVYKFDYKDPQGAPKKITQGNVRLMVRFTSKAVDAQKWWNEIGCAKVEIAGVTLGCGCQKVAPLTDSSTTKKSNLMHIITPLGQCSGGKKWMWIEDVSKEGKSMSGDFILRMEVETSGAAPVPDAGSSGDGGSGIIDAGGPKPQDAGSVDQGPPPIKNPVIDLITPKEVMEGKITAIDILGKHFEAGAIVKVGKYKCQVSKVSENKIEANVLSDVPAGLYAVIVENPSGGIGFKDDALTVTAPPEEDAGPADTGPEDTGPPDTGPPDAGPPPKPEIELITPDHGPGDVENEITIVGKNFEDGATVKIGSAKQLVVSVTATKIEAKVLAPMVPGVYTVLIENPNGQVGFKEKAYTVDEPPKPDPGPVDAGQQDTGPVGVPAVVPAADSGCSSANSSNGAAGALLLLCLVALVGWRRRLA